MQLTPLSASNNLNVLTSDIASIKNVLVRFHDFNEKLNDGEFDLAFDLMREIEDTLEHDFAAITTASPENLFEQISKSNRAFCAQESSLFDIVSGLLYGKALIGLVIHHDYQGSGLNFNRAFRLLQICEQQHGLTPCLRHRLWRSAYHEGLAAFSASNAQDALKIFYSLFYLQEFQDHLGELDANRLSNKNGKEVFASEDHQLIPSDVVSGVLYYAAQSHVLLKDYLKALPLLKAAAVIEGNSVSCGVRKLAESKVSECYIGLIKTSNFVDLGKWSVLNRVEVTFHNRRSFPTRSIFSTQFAVRQNSISAIIPVFNGAQMLEQTLLSVAGQSLFPDEMIVIDDGSTDDSLEAVSKMIEHNHFPFDVITIKTANGGQSRARNIGALVATSQLIAYLDQDDLWYPVHLQMLKAPFERNRNLGWTYSDLDEVDLEGKMMNRKFLDVVAPKRRFNTVRDLVHADMFILPSASLISRSALLKIKGFDQELSGYEDDDLFIRLFREGFEHAFVDEALSQWRIHKGSCSYQMRMIISRRKFQEKLCKAFPDDPSMGRFWVRDFISPRFFANGLNRFNVGLETGDFAMCEEALTDMKTSMQTMVATLRTRLLVFMCHFPALFKRIRKIKTHSRYR